MPSVVTAGVPSRRPLVYQGPFGSKGKELRFSVMPTSRTMLSAWRPVSPKGRTSIKSRWLSVPRVATVMPSAMAACGQRAGVLHDARGVGRETPGAVPR